MKKHRNIIKGLVGIGAVLLVASTALLAGEIVKREKTIEELVTEALELAVKHLQPSTVTACTTLEYVTPAEQLRRAAKEMEERDADIERIRATLSAWKAYQAAQRAKQTEQPANAEVSGEERRG